MRRLAVMFAALLVVLVGVASPAQAHAVVVSTNPPQGGTVASAPSEVTMTFSESISPVKDKIRVTAPDGSRADKGETSVDGAVLRIPLRDDLPIGTYLVSYRVISADSHPVPGGFTFNIGAPSATVPTPTTDDSSTSRPIAVSIGVAKYVGYAGLLLAVGAAMVLLLLWPARMSRRGPRRALAAGFGLVVLSTLGQFVLQAPYVNGVPLNRTTADDLAGVLDSQFGAVMLARIGLLAVAAIVLSGALRRIVSHGEPARSDLVILGILFAGAASTWPLAGHSAASPVPAVTVVIDTVHIAAMAVWLGGLAMLTLFLLRPKTATERELTAIMPVWSRWATLSVSALLLAGVVQALIEIGTLKALVTTTYGWLILAKVALVVVILGFAYLARSYVYNAPAGNVLRWAVRVELGIAAVIIGVSATLTQTTPARVAADQPSTVQQTQNYFTTSVKAGLYTLQVDVDPAKTGQNVVHLYAYTPEGKPLKVVEWAASAALPTAGIEPVTMPLLPLTDNHASGSINLPTPGDWQMKFTLRTTEVDQESVTVTVPVG
ncbi:copper transport protein [Hamadaea flava]|uniref:Copper resistance CopC/CopD family protein n=1 Tax=Hamadaea flava TaxID=1742688 RepID=A0ABV8M2C9_9ACTN|nr:copper resistance protein CopC [Hamadaea flava]MCP2326911.1 copper transport protein [Hamadaea flava]